MSQKETLPRHIAIIMDGNGRWAKKRGLPRTAGHRAGIKALRRTIKNCKNNGIKYLTVYAFSTENWARPKDEINTLFSLFKFFLRREVNKLIKQKIKIQFIGRLHEFSDDIKILIEEVGTKMNFEPEMTFTVALNYGARQEIVDAVNEMIRRDVSEIDQMSFNDFLYTAGMPDVDLLVRTSGELRISNFLLWQCAYAEFYFTEAFWPDFDEKELNAAIAAYQRRERRFGGLK